VNYKLLGNTGLRVSELFRGGMTFGENWGWGPPLEECRRLIDLYAEAGGNVIDTAVNYTDSASEEIIGELIEPVRDRFVLATKYTLSTDPTDPNAAGNYRKNLTRSLETGLSRLRTDYIDLYWVHIWDPRTPLEETMRALDDAVRQGRVLDIGLSDTPAWPIARVNALAQCRDWTPAAAIQLPYNLVQRDPERDLLPMAATLGLSVAAWSPLAGGLPSGKFTNNAPTAQSRVDPASISERDLAIARHVQRAADALGATPSQVAIASTMAHNPRVHPIIGVRRADQLEANLGALNVLQSLVNTAELRDLDEASRIELWFPHDFITSTSSLVYGDVGTRVEHRRVI
jgi:aryl-alcohol dehydrogenase-like predicted oxidoreductase